MRVGEGGCKREGERDGERKGREGKRGARGARMCMGERALSRVYSRRESIYVRRVYERGRDDAV